jgi:hypothetical protein
MVFTPVDWSSIRLHFEDKDVVFSSNYKEGRYLGYKGDVTIKGKKYQVYGKSCSIPGCNCDAQIIEI